jgi:hypothetical protein
LNDRKPEAFQQVELPQLAGTGPTVKVSADGAEVHRLSWFCKGTTNGSDFVAIRITHIEGGIEIGVGLDFSRET